MEVSGSISNDNCLEELPQLFQLPILVREIILKCLPRIDLLRLRLACKTTNEWATEFMQNKRGYSYLYPIEILEQEGAVAGDSGYGMTFGDILARPYFLPIRYLYINNANGNGEDIWNDPNLEEFLQTYAHGIQKLKLENFSISSLAQAQFFSRLENLTQLKICTIDAHVEIYYKQRSPKLLPVSIPNETCEKIQVLKVGQICSSMVLSTDYHIVFLEKFPNLRILRLPELEFDRKIPGTNNQWKFDYLKLYIETQEGQNNGIPILEKIDFKNLNDWENDLQFCTSDMIIFLEWVKVKPIELLNVNERFFFILQGSGDRVTHDDEGRDNFRSIVSMKNMSQNLVYLELTMLRKLDITVSQCIEPYHFDPAPWFWSLMITEFESLRSLRFYYDIPHPNRQGATTMNTFFFERHYLKLEELSIEFGEAWETGKIPTEIFSARNLTTYFSDIRKLELVNWNPGNKSFVRLWNLMSDLEELVLKDCSSLGNVGFIGENENEPAFLNLKGLRKLTLKVDKMKNLTDRTFKDVFRHLALTEFVLITEVGPMDRITRTGIEWLLKGRFAESVIKFPFTTWTATTIPANEMLHLKAQFKSLLF